MMMRRIKSVFIVTVMVAFSVLAGWGQAAAPKPAEVKPLETTTQAAPRPVEGYDPYRAGKPTEEKTFYFNYATAQNDLNEIVTAVRNIINPGARIYLVLSQKAMVVRAVPEDLVTIQKMLDELDRSKKTYRLTYTINEMDGGKRIGTQHFAMVLAAGQRTQMKQGSKVPVVTGTNKDGGSLQNAVSYLDIGMNFDATLEESANGVSLRTKVEQLSLAEEKSGVGVQDPVIRQTALEGSSFLVAGKPLVLGSVDIPGSTRRLDVEVVMEQVK